MLGAVSYWPSVVTILLSCIICEIEREILVENRDFFIQTLHLTPPFREFPSEYYHPVWHGKTRMVRLPDGKKNFEDLCNRLEHNTGV